VTEAPVRNLLEQICAKKKTGPACPELLQIEYLSLDLPYKPSPKDILLTSGGTQAIEIVMSVLGQPGSNILLPKPAGYPKHEAHAIFVRNYDLVLESGCEVDLEAVQALADENTVAILITNANNPCGSVYTYEHLAKCLYNFT
jgi:aspartate/methionine/tyrosine aminotransferase